MSARFPRAGLESQQECIEPVYSLSEGTALEGEAGLGGLVVEQVVQLVRVGLGRVQRPLLSESLALTREAHVHLVQLVFVCTPYRVVEAVIFSDDPAGRCQGCTIGPRELGSPDRIKCIVEPPFRAKGLPVRSTVLVRLSVTPEFRARVFSPLQRHLGVHTFHPGHDPAIQMGSSLSSSESQQSRGDIDVVRHCIVLGSGMDPRTSDGEWNPNVCL